MAIITLRDKSVAVVGNAASLFDRQYGLEIDSHDVVIRLNRAAIVTEKAHSILTHGSKTTVWIVWRYNEYEQIQRLTNIQLVLQVVHWDTPQARLNEAVLQIDKQIFDSLTEKLDGALPSTGLTAIEFALRHSPRQVTCYGFDWKKTPTFTDISREVDARINKDNQLHNFEKERQYCNSLKPAVLFRH